MVDLELEHYRNEKKSLVLEVLLKNDEDTDMRFTSMNRSQFADIDVFDSVGNRVDHHRDGTEMVVTNHFLEPGETVRCASTVIFSKEEALVDCDTVEELSDIKVVSELSVEENSISETWELSI